MHDRLYPNEAMKTHWYRMLVCTSGLMGHGNYGQPFSRNNACPLCGAGAEPIPPLVVNLRSMGKKKLDATAHEGLIVIRNDLAEQIRASSLTGYKFDSVRHFAHNAISSEYVWMRIVNQWPPLHKKSKFDIDVKCQTCQRSGYCDIPNWGTILCYNKVPKNMADFGLTWEYWGVWNAPNKKAKNVGGAQYPIVSLAVRELFEQINIVDE